MSIGTRIKECREKLGMTQEELATLLGVSKGAIGNYEAGIGYPKVENMTKLFKILKTDANFLFQDEVSTKVKEMLTNQERQHIQKYRTLDTYGKKVINTVLDIEFERCKQICESASVQSNAQSQSKIYISKTAARNGRIPREEILTQEELDEIRSRPDADPDM